MFSLSVVLPSSTQTLLIPAIPTLAADRGFSVATNGWLLSAFLIGASISAPLVGRIGDLRGRRNLTVLTSAAHVVGSIICLVAGDQGLAVAGGRALQGFSAGVFVLHISTIQQLVPTAAARAAHIGVLSGVVGMGPAIGFLVGGAVTAQLGVSMLFVIGVLAGSVSTVLLWVWTPESGGQGHGSVDVRGAALVALSLFLFLTFLAQVGVHGLGGRTTLLSLLGTLLALVTTVVWMRRVAVPFIDLEVLKNRTSTLGNAATAFSSAAMFGLFVVVPQLVQDDAHGFGMGPVAAGLFLVPGALAMVLVGPLAGRAGASRGFGLVIVVGNALCAAGLLAMGLLPWSVAGVLVLATIASVGVGVAFPAMPSVVMDAVPHRAVGAAAGINSLVRGVGSAAGAQIALMVSASASSVGAGGHRQAFVIGAFGAVGAVFVGLGIARSSTVRGS